MKGKKILSIITSIAIVFGAFVSLPFVLGAANPAYNENLDWSYTPPTQNNDPFTSKQITLNNANLSDTVTSSTFSFSSNISSWTSDINVASTLGGALNLRQFAKFKSDNKLDLSYLSVPPINMGDNVFVITNNKFEESSSKGSFTSQEVTFDANSYYMVSVNFYAVNGFGSFYLVPTETFDDKVATPRINLPIDSFIGGVWDGNEYVPNMDNPQYQVDPETGVVLNMSSWRTATFLVKTDPLTAQHFKLGLYLGSMATESKGVIYFQNPSVEQVNYDYYASAKKQAYTDSQGNTTSTINAFTQIVELDGTDANGNYYFPANQRSYLDRPGDPNSTFNKPQFETNNLDPKAPVNPEYLGTFARLSVSTANIPGMLNFKDVDFVNPVNIAREGAVGTQMNANVMLLAANDSHASLRLTDVLTDKTTGKPTDGFIIRRSQIYIISFYTLTGQGQNVTMRIRDKDYDTKKTGEYYDSAFKNISTSGTDAQNGWALNTFFITGESYYDITVDIEFWVGTDSQSATDWALIDGFDIARVSYDYFNKQSSVSADNKLTMDTTAATSGINNAYFNMGTPRSIEQPYPLVPNDWLVADESDEKVLTGIVNTDPEQWNFYSYAGDGKSSNYGIATIKPGAISGQDINNNVLMIQNRSLTWQNVKSPAISLSSGVTNIITFDLMKQYSPILGLNAWVSATVGDREVARLDLGVAPSNGSGATQWQNYAIAVQNSSISNHDLTLTFNMGSADKLCPAGIIYLDNVSISQSETIPTGATIADLSDTGKFFTTSDTNIGIGTMSDGILQIQNTDRTKATSAKNTLTDTLDGGSFYKYTVRVRIDDTTAYNLMKEDEIDTKDIKDIKKLKKPVNDKDWGVYFTLDGFDGGFQHLTEADIIKMQGLDTDGFAEIVFYVRPDASNQLSLVVTFGDQYNAVTGIVYIKKLTIETIDETTFDDAKTAYDLAVKQKNEFGYSNATFITQSYVPPEDNGQSAGHAPIQWWYVVPTLIMAVAVLIGIVGFLVRRYKFKFHIDKYHTSYASDDRSARTKQKR